MVAYLKNYFMKVNRMKIFFFLSFQMTEIKKMS